MLESLQKIASKFFSLASKEVEVLEELHGEVQATLTRLEADDPGLKELLSNAHAYAVFPSVGKATAVIGGAFGKGEVFERGKMIGYAAIAQLTLGVQIGGQTFSEIIAFQDKAALDRFKQGRFAFAANASAVLVKGGAAASANYERGVAVFVSSEGGMMLEAAIGAQKFFFRPAVIGRVAAKPSAKKSPHHPTAKKKKKARRARPAQTTASPKAKANPASRPRSRKNRAAKKNR
jgi:lipid-binding SYLF domain-containing protein